MKLEKKRPRRRLKKGIKLLLIVSFVVLGIRLSGITTIGKQGKVIESVLDTVIITKQEETKIYVEYPVLKHDSVSTFLKYYAQDAIKDFESSISLNKEGSELNLKFETFTVNEHIVTIRFNRYEYQAHNANGLSSVDVFNFDTNSGTLIQLEEVFDQKDDYERFLKIAKDDIEAVWLANDLESEYVDDATVNTILANELKFGFTKEGLALYFDEYTLTPGYMGPLELIYTEETLPGLMWDKLHDTHNFGEDVAVVYDRIVNEREIGFYQDKKLIALTFDDGPHPKYTAKVLDTLAHSGVPATFFFLGQNIEKYPDLVRRAFQEGHQVANHTFNHYDLVKLDETTYREEIDKTEMALNEIGISSNGYVRPPYGSFDPNRLEKSQEKFILWNIDSMDWRSKDSDKIVATIDETAKENGIVLMHDIYDATQSSLDTVIKTLKEKGYHFVTVETLLKFRGGIEAGSAYYNGRKS